VSKGTNRNLDARITLEQLSALYTDPESHNAQRHRQTDRRTDRQTDGQQAYANSRSYCVAVRSAKSYVTKFATSRLHQMEVNEPMIIIIS